ncbi:hypothetical protein PRIPAC_74840 [Pristionchus pacificus]|nr:hypothetical protein PRIPAC_74840 [Pristionchus pacificus]
MGGSHLGVELTLSSMYKRSLITITDFPRTLRRPTTTDHRVVPTGESCIGASVLEEKYKKFVEDPKSKGTIYVAFGSLVQWDQGPKEVFLSQLIFKLDKVLQIPIAFIRAFNQLRDYRIIWTYSGRELDEKMGDHILITKWAPQNDLLAHKNTKMFFTHGGLKSIKEGICSSVPLLMMPFFADQMMIAATAVEKGLALNVYKKNATEVEILSKIRQVLDNSEQMKESAIKVSLLYIMAVQRHDFSIVQYSLTTLSIPY